MTGDTGIRIRNRRKDIGLTQEELGKRIGVTKATINKYETGVVINLRRPTVEKIAVALEVDPGYLMGWTDSAAGVHTNNGVIGQIGQNSGTVSVSGPERALSKEELELLRIYSLLDVKRRLRLIQAALALEAEKCC